MHQPRRRPRAARVAVVAATLALALGLSAAVGQEQPPPSGFVDIAGNPHAANIDYVVWWGIAQGVTASEYRPAQEVTRAQMASFLARMIGHGPTPLPQGAPAAFDDVAGNTHEANINALAAAGVVRGIGERTYGPGLAVTRAQMATFLVRAWEYATGEPLTASYDYFTDTAGNPHEDNINRAAEAGFASGTTATTFSPAASVRRDQMASFIARTVRRMVDHGHATPPAEPAPVERDWWRDLGVVIDPEDVGLDPAAFAVSDIKVAALPGGGYVAVLASHSPDEVEPARFHTLASDDLVSWTEVARFDMPEMLAQGFYIGSLVALPDDTLTMIGVSDQPGDPVVSSSSADGGVTWTADPGPLLSNADFDREVRLTTLAVVERPEGGWRMYVSANDCTRPNVVGGDNCPDGEALQTWPLGVESVFSAVSDDLAHWTVEAGVRFQGSRERGSMNHPDAWVDDDGRVRLTGHMRWSPNSHWAGDDMGPWGQALGELISDDGLQFPAAGYRDYFVPLSDVQVVRAPDGSVRMLAGAQSDRLVDDGSQIRLLAAATIGWQIDPVVPLPLAWQVPPAEQPDDPFLFCFQIDVHGAATVRFDVRASGWPWTPGSSPSDLHEVSSAVVQAPASTFVKRQDSFDHPERTWATYVVATDDNGVSWFVAPFGHAEHGFPGEVHGHDFASFPCPP